MDLRQLEIYVAVAEAEHVTQGARRAHIAQSAASSAIRRLERELGTELFNRVGRRIELTYAGQVLLDRARVVLGEVRRTHEQLALLAGPLLGHVSLSIPISCGGFDLPGALAAFRDRYPAVTIGIRQTMGSVEERTAVLFQNEADLAIVPVSGMEPPQVRIERLSRLRAALACRADDDLAARHGVRLADIADRTFVDFPPDWGNRRTIDRMFASASVQRHVAIEVADTRLAQLLIASGLGIGFLPQESLAERSLLARVNLVEQTPWFDVALASRSDQPLPQAAAALRQVLLSFATADLA